MGLCDCLCGSTTEDDDGGGGEGGRAPVTVYDAPNEPATEHAEATPLNAATTDGTKGSEKKASVKKPKAAPEAASKKKEKKEKEVDYDGDGDGNDGDGDGAVEFPELHGALSLSLTL
jgi:hypothetical protein